MEFRIYDLRVEIVRVIKHSSVLQLLVPHIINQTDAKDIKRQYGVSTERANHRLLDLLIKSTEPGKWTAFQDALKESNYPHLASLLKTADATCYNQQRRVLELFAPLLEQNLNPIELINILYQRDILDQRDMEEVVAEQKNSGCISATMILLERMQTHLEPDKWYSGFLEALYESGYEYLVQNVDPDFYEKRNLGRGYSINHADCISSVGSDEKATTDESESTVNRTVLENINRYWTIIVELLDIKSIIDRLVPVVITSDIRNELIQKYDYSRTQAVSQLLDHVISTENGVKFVSCLEQSDYPYLAQLLRKECPSLHNSYCEKVVQIFLPAIQYDIRIPDIVSRLVEKDVITGSDSEIIQAEYCRKGNTSAAVVLLDCVQTRISPEEWYCKFLQVLMETSHEHVVQKIEPDFIKNPGRFAMKMKEVVNEVPYEESASGPSGCVGEELKRLHEMRQVYLKMKRNADNQIKVEKKFMVKFVKDKCEKLQEELNAKALEFETQLDQYKLALVELKERSETLAENGGLEEELRKLKNKYTRFSNDVRIEVKFERNLNLHFLKSIGYVTEAGPGNLKKGEAKFDGVSHENTLLAKDKVNLAVDNISNQSSSDLGSSFIHITGLKEIDDPSSDDDDFENQMNEEIESDTFTFELLITKQIPALHKLMMKDIVALPGQKLAGLCDRRLIIIETERFVAESYIPLSDDHFNKLVSFKDNAVAVISPDLEPVTVAILNESKTIQYEWHCEFEKCTMVSRESSLYILCMGRHLHVYRGDEGKQDMYNLGVPLYHTWRPKCAILNESGTELYISDVDSVYCFKYLAEQRELRFQWTHYGESVIERQLFVGISVFDENLIILDKNSNAVIQLSTQGGFFRGSIKSSTFSDCDLVAFDRQKNLVHLISYRYKEYKKVKLVSSRPVEERNITQYDPYVLIN